MMDSHTMMTLAMSAVVALAVGIYVVLDGFDLGLGILFSLTRDSSDRDRMMNSIAPFWDGNETWLVLGGAVLIAMFPSAFAVILPAVYLPVIVMLLALIFRGVAFEFRFKHTPRKLVWDIAFASGSIVATIAQGFVLGTFVQGIPVVDGKFAGGSMDWMTPFASMTALGLVAGYALLGACWLYWRVSGALRQKAERWVPWLLLTLFAAISGVSFWTPLVAPAIAARWFHDPGPYVLAPLPLLAITIAWALLRSMRKEVSSGWPFACAIGLFATSYLGLAISIFPMLPPPSMSLFDSASSVEAQRFLLPGVAVLVPFILLRTWLNYRIFRMHGDDDPGYELE